MNAALLLAVMTAAPHLAELLISLVRKPSAIRRGQAATQAMDGTFWFLRSIEKGPGDGPPSPNSRAYRGAMSPRGRGLEDNVCRVAPFMFLQYIARMLSRVRNSRGRPINAPPCQPW
jgi:hypothetical protein